MVSGIQLYKKSITISLIIFKKPRKMTNNFFNNSFTRSGGHHQHFVVFFQDFRFSSKKSQIQEKLAKKIIYCTINFRLENLTHFTNLNSLDIEKKYAPATKPKVFLTLQIFQQTSAWCQKNHSHCTISRRPRTEFSKHFESKCL